MTWAHGLAHDERPAGRIPWSRQPLSHLALKSKLSRCSKSETFGTPTIASRKLTLIDRATMTPLTALPCARFSDTQPLWLAIGPDFAAAQIAKRINLGSGGADDGRPSRRLWRPHVRSCLEF